MAIAPLHLRPIHRTAHRVERRNRKRTVQARAAAAIRTAAWTVTFLALGWLLLAGFYGLMVSA